MPTSIDRQSLVDLASTMPKTLPSISVKNLLKARRAGGRRWLEQPLYCDSVLPEEFQKYLPEDTDEIYSGCQDINGLWYCEAHARDVCHQCKIITRRGVLLDFFYRNSAHVSEYGPPRQSKYPKNYILQKSTATGDHTKILLGLRWVQMQKLLYSECEGPKLSRENSKLIRLPTIKGEVLDKMNRAKDTFNLGREVSTTGESLETTSLATNIAKLAVESQGGETSPAGGSADKIKKQKPAWMTLQDNLLCHLLQVQGITVSRRYHFANQPRILLQDYDTFRGAAVLYEQELLECMSRRWDVNPIAAGSGNPCSEFEGHVYKLKAKSTILNTFGFFLEIKTSHTFWRMMELTVEAFLQHVKSYDDKKDGQFVLTNKPRQILLDWIAHAFWALQLAQYRLDRLQNMQHALFQRGEYPFYPYVLEALATPRAKLDVQLIILKLSKFPMYDFPLISSLFEDFKGACNFPDQMKEVNEQLMAGIEELSERFEAIQIMIHAAHLVASEREIKAALTAYPFERYCKEVNSKFQDVVAIIDTIHVGKCNPRTEGNLSFMHKSMVRENTFRRAHMDSFTEIPGLKPTITKEEVFDCFKARYMFLTRDIRRHWREDEQSLLPPSAMRRFHDPRQEINKIRNGLSTQESLPVEVDEQAEIAEARYVPSLYPGWSWEGPGAAIASVEKYSPPEVRIKVKTRSNPVSSAVVADSSASIRPSSDSMDATSDSKSADPKRSLSRLKESDLVTRDILWRKTKGNLKWGDLLQFLTRLGYGVLNKMGSIRKVFDPVSGAWTDLHRPHPSETCRPDQVQNYRERLEDFLKLKYDQLLTAGEKGT